MMLIYRILFISLTALACHGLDKSQPPGKKENELKIQAKVFDTGSFRGMHVRSMLEDSNGNLWIATDGNGACRYSGNSITWFSGNEGLCSDNVWTIQEDKKGNLWFGTRNGICQFDGKSISNVTTNYSLKTYSYSPAFEFAKGNLWFGANGGVNGYDGKSFTFFPINKQHQTGSLMPGPRPSGSSPYSVYTILEDRAGNLWFGTELNGVCRYDGKTFTWFHEKDLNKGAVRCIYEDSRGTLWFGTNGGGVCYYDGKSITNFSEEKGLSNHLANSRLEDTTQQLNRVWSITEDKSGNIWFGTIDEGAWRFDGKSMVNFSKKDGLASNAVWTIFRDKTGQLLFGTDGDGISQYDGKSFTRFTGYNF